MADLHALRALGLDSSPATIVALEADAQARRLCDLITSKTKIGPRFASSIRVKISTEPGRRSSWGGWRNGAPFISLSLNTISLARSGNVYTFHEYPSVANKPGIHSLHNCTWQQYVACLVAHEIAHAYAHAFHRYVPGAKSIEDAHGPNWQALYRAFRSWLTV